MKLGASVTGFSLPPHTSPNLFDLARLQDGMTSIFGDIRDLGQLRSAIETSQPEIVIHMAAQALVRYSYENPVETYETNVMGTVNVLETVRQSDSVRVVLIITSDKCYENQEWLWGYRETDPMGGYDPYSSSKGCAEIIASAYRRSYFGSDPRIFLATARAGNVIGGGDWSEDRLVPDIIRAFLNQEAPVIRNPNAVRPWQHVLEPLRGYLMLAEGLWKKESLYADAWNFGPNEEGTKTVSWIVKRLLKIWGPDKDWQIDGAQQPHEAAFLKLDCARSKNILGWVPKLEISEALRWIVAWYLAYQQGEDMRIVTENEIKRYEALL